MPTATKAPAIVPMTDPPTSDPSPDFDAGRLRVDLDALAENWRALADIVGPEATTSAVVKGDAYGIGLEPAARALSDAGCGVFFVATPREGGSLRRILPSATIFILDGLIAGSAGWLGERDLRPVLGSVPEIDEWRAARAGGTTSQSAIMVDTGMNRLGLTAAELSKLADSRDALDELGATLMMSHLACADTPRHEANQAQLAQFRVMRARLPGIKASLANSAGIFLGRDYHFDLARPGIALFGGAAAEAATPAIRPVVTFQARVLQIRQAKKGETVGYGAAERLKRPSRIAIVGTGYADGYLRRAGSSDARAGARAFVGGRFAPLVGRVSMDLTAIDVTGIATVERGDWIEMFGEHVSVDEVAGHADTIGYEVLTGLGRRMGRLYAGHGR